MNQLININHQALINMSMVCSSNSPVTPLLLLRDTAAGTLSTFGDIFIDPRSDLWVNGPLVFITEEHREGNICTNEGVWIGNVCLELRYRCLRCVQTDRENV